MTSARWLLFLLLAGLLVGYAAWNYRRRELPVEGARVLLVIRSLVLAGLLLLLLNPRLPWGASASAGAWRLLDVSLSMNASDGAAWRDARAGAETSRTLTFGVQPRSVTALELDSLLAGDPSSRLLPALQVAAQGGANNVVVASDLRVSDLGQALAEAARLGLDVGFEDVGQPTRNVGVAEVDFPEVAERGGFQVSVALFGEGLGGRDVSVDVFEEAERVASAIVVAPTPEDGLIRTTLDVPGPSHEGSMLRYSVRVSVNGDEFGDDDERIVYLFTEGEEGGVVFASWAPDFEARFMLPVLSAATGLRPTLLLGVGPDRFIEGGRDGVAGRSLTLDEVRTRLARSRLAVVHGIGADRPTWFDAWVVRAQSVLVIPAMSEVLTPFDAIVSGPIEGQWLVDPVLPASPIAGELSGVRMEALPPLASSFTVGDVPRSFAPVRVRRDGRGQPEPALLLAETGNRRWGAALTSGYFRWMLRGGEAEEAYRRLWSAVGAWLVTKGSAVAGDQVQPSSRTFRRGQTIGWQAPGLAGDTLRLNVLVADTPVLDTLLTVGADEQLTSGVLDPGTYRYVVAAGEQTIAEGRFDVERFTADLRLPRQDPERIGASVGAGDRVRILGRRRIRTSMLPYLLLIGLLLVEWVARRRSGLR